ncbi:MAG: phosphoglucosamine mutase, partial [Actinomycetes bacterium]
VATSGRSLAELAAAAMSKLPQVLLNVAVEDPQAAAQLPSVIAAAEEISAALAESGRVLLRPSGTEALVRVMVEASTEPEALQIAERLAEVVRLAASEASNTTTVR